MSIAFVVGILISSFALWQILQRRAQAEVTTQGLMLIETMNSVRNYTSEHIRPLLADQIATQPTFIAETVPAFSAREVFETFRTETNQANFLYKEAALNPTNLRDSADPFEADLLQQMRQADNPEELFGYRNRDGTEVFYIARPLTIGSESCLECHGDPAAAPQSLLDTYGSENGFGWQVNETVAVQMIYVPAQDLFDQTIRAFSLVTGTFIVTLIVVALLITMLLRRYILQPVGVLGSLAQKVRADQLAPDDLRAPSLVGVTQSADELGQLATVFQRMAQEVYERTEILKFEVQQLSIQIDDIKRKQQVAEIVDTDFFQELQSKARQMRAKE
ncbi:MAG: DUF3365 domain-containing protein [Chloroflexota bacterium]